MTVFRAYVLQGESPHVRFSHGPVAPWPEAHYSKGVLPLPPSETKEDVFRFVKLIVLLKNEGFYTILFSKYFCRA